jgi:hypothetical protein
MADKATKHTFSKPSNTNLSSRLNIIITKPNSCNTKLPIQPKHTSINQTNTPPQTTPNSNMQTSNAIPPKNTNNQDNDPTKKTFAVTTANFTFPKKDQAIVFNTIDGTPQIDYINALSTITNPINIKFASRISNNRFCIYLASKEIVDEIINNFPTITVNNHTIPIRKLEN